MASTLAQQLASVAGARKAGASQPAAGGSRKKPSLLFDQQKAADVDAHTLYLIGCEGEMPNGALMNQTAPSEGVLSLPHAGLEALCKLEPRFTGFRSSLFSQASVNFVRDQQTVETLENLEGVLSHFFDCLTEHFLSPGCFKALEYLIRKYRINEYNVHALLSMALPFHSTHEFVRLVQTLSLFNSQASQSIKSCWGWLSRMQESGASLPRDVLVQRCINDRAVFRALCEGAKRNKRASSGASSPTYLSFYAVVICEMVAFPGALNEEVLERLLPYLVEGLEPTSSVDYRAASLMIFAEVCARVSLSQPFLTGESSGAGARVNPRCR